MDTLGTSCATLHDGVEYLENWAEAEALKKELEETHMIIISCYCWFVCSCANFLCSASSFQSTPEHIIWWSGDWRSTCPSSCWWSFWSCQNGSVLSSNMHHFIQLCYINTTGRLNFEMQYFEFQTACNHKQPIQNQSSNAPSGSSLRPKVFLRKRHCQLNPQMISSMCCQMICQCMNDTIHACCTW